LVDEDAVPSPLIGAAGLLWRYQEISKVAANGAPVLNCIDRVLLAVNGDAGCERVEP
jgi:hypothetical protein